MYKSELEERVKRISDRMESNHANTIAYYNKNNELLAISTPECFVIAVNIQNDEKRIMLVSFKKDGNMINSQMDRNRLWYVPNENALVPVKRLISPLVVPKENFPSCYLIYNFGVLELPNFKGCSMSKSKMDVYIQSCDGNCYSATYVAGEGSIAGNDNYYGDIVGGYQFATLGTYVENEITLSV